MGVTGFRKIESDRDYQKNKERIQELKILWKREKLLSTINEYIETFDTNTTTSFTSQIVTFKILTQVPFLCVSPFLIFFLLPPKNLDSFWNENLFP